MKLLFTAVFIFSIAASAVSQTLFTYGPYSASTEEFLRAFEKNNNTASTGKREQDIRNYLDLYTRFKLKVQEAYDLRLDTLVMQQPDVQNFRQQIEEPFLTDDAEIKKLTEEAFTRAQKDIRLAHIFIPFRMEFISNPSASLPLTAADSAASMKKINEAYGKIRNGEDFARVAAAYSADPSTVSNKGEIGYITVFNLPYALENVAYSLKPGETSPPFISSAGYHIFKNLGERPAAGHMKVSQILIAYDLAGSAAEKAKAKKLTDSLYRALLGGAPFDKLAVKFSNDKQSNIMGGVMSPVGVGQYDPVFENIIFSLHKNGEISSPFEAGDGFHIVKRLEQIPVDKDFTTSKLAWKSAVEKDKRASLARISFEKKAIIQTGLKKTNFAAMDLWNYSDTFFKKGVKIATTTINENSVLLEFPKGRSVVTDWIKYVVASNKLTSPGDYPGIWEDFVGAEASSYYRKHLEDFNPEYRLQLKEFKEGNMLFEVMEKKVWNKSATDTAGLRNYYLTHKSRYTWQKSADVIIISASDSLHAVKTRKLLTARPASWKNIAASSDGTVLADSSRVEWTQIPANASVIKAGLVTKVQVSEDRTASFTYVIKTYPQPSPRNFVDARGLVMNDFQQDIEERWIAELKTRYPVKVNEVELLKLIR